MQTAHHWTLNLSNGLKGNVPADLDNPVTLTLLEVEAWPEHDFLRQLIQPGMRLLDADTGLGLDALARALNTHPLFARSVADNGLQAVIQTPTPQPNQTRVHSAPNLAADEGLFDLIRLCAETPLDPRWLQPAGADPEPVADEHAADPFDTAAVAVDHAAVAAEANGRKTCYPFFLASVPSTAWLREQGRLILSA